GGANAMSQTAVEYVEQTAEGGWRLCQSRVSLDSVVHAFWEGQSPEAIAEEFPTLSVEQVYGAIAFYLRNKAEIDRYLSRQDQNWEQFRQESQAKHGPLLERLRANRGAPAKRETPS